MSHCARCGAEFICEMMEVQEKGQAADTSCWCMRLPPLPAATLQKAKNDSRAREWSGCLCQSCLLALASSASAEQGAREA